jgi:hypothetical protein
MQSTAAMREWAVLKWYEFAAQSVLRGECCPSAPALEWGFKLACPIDESRLAVVGHEHGAHCALIEALQQLVLAVEHVL